MNALYEELEEKTAKGGGNVDDEWASSFEGGRNIDGDEVKKTERKKKEKEKDAEKNGDAEGSASDPEIVAEKDDEKDDDDDESDAAEEVEAEIEEYVVVAKKRQPSALEKIMEELTLDSEMLDDGRLVETVQLIKTRFKARSIHWSPYDRVRVVNADP